ncbi:NADH dehydrogenase [ubiquinone] 1 beta subcomplex subunit 8, mitochondrial-like [Sinocyclocheilus anshuiensis]|uniref:NADH dehydrogenase [ubiquinone] 1 beta subcomplex subunit 8, mitochondrial-like n=1 Tax=Sinocyclocheilus anshuiensis TaxID=1608454 RepID=UPI0007B7D11E|nr:PREDICTED: NADH dehydrogenase [ubiquinone] 1 beta subcomplex subunit 8, mitochondrial-like [Sinocyclocheilus anshuiensis]
MEETPTDIPHLKNNPQEIFHGSGHNERFLFGVQPSPVSKENARAHHLRVLLVEGCSAERRWGIVASLGACPLRRIGSPRMRAVACQRGKMAALRAGLLTRALTKGNTPGIPNIILGTRAASGPSKDMLPGSYPRTPEETAAAAKKYNMTLEDYKPYPDDGMGYGDYPLLPERSQQERDPWYQWDHPDLRRNWGEPSRRN